MAGSNLVPLYPESGVNCGSQPAVNDDLLDSCRMTEFACVHIAACGGSADRMTPDVEITLASSPGERGVEGYPGELVQYRGIKADHETTGIGPPGLCSVVGHQPAKNPLVPTYGLNLDNLSQS